MSAGACPASVAFFSQFHRSCHWGWLRTGSGCSLRLLIFGFWSLFFPSASLAYLPWSGVLADLWSADFEFIWSFSLMLACSSVHFHFYSWLGCFNLPQSKIEVYFCGWPLILFVFTLGFWSVMRAISVHWKYFMIFSLTTIYMFWSPLRSHFFP